MIWVIFIHCLYWLGYFSWYKSFFLAEMSLFFFIAGASNGMASKKSLGNFYLSRFQRIMIPYWIYGLVCIALMLIFRTAVTIKGFWILPLTWIIPFGSIHSSIPYLPRALWFIPVYLLVMLFFPLFEKMRNTRMRYLPFVLLFGGIVALDIWGIDGAIADLTQKIVFYSFFTYFGLFFTEITKKTKPVPAYAVLAIALLAMAVLAVYFGQSLNMQHNKFPPNTMFFFYSLAALSILYILSDNIVKAVKFLRKNVFFDWIYQQYTQRGLTIFLFHPIVFVLLAYLKTCFAVLPQAISFAIVLLLAIPLSAVIGKMFSWVEHIFSKSIR